MTWQEMSDEILADVAPIMSASSTTEYVIGVMQWRSKTVAGPVYQPNILPVKVHDGETPADVSGVSILPDPDTVRCGHWRPVNLKLTPKINGIATSEDVPALYLVGLKPPGAQGVAFPSRYGGGVVLWCGNPNVIEHVQVGSRKDRHPSRGPNRDGLIW